MTRILVVDDHALVRGGMSQLLASFLPGCEVVQAANRAQALAALRAAQQAFDLVTLDIDLPDSDRLALLAEIRRDHPALPVVIMSALEDPVLAAQALQLGAVGYIPKSIDGQVIESALRVVLAGGSYVPPFLLAARREAQTSNGELTQRQRDVLALLVEGWPTKDIARRLDLSEATVKTHLAAIFRVLRVKNRAQAVTAGRAYMLTAPPA